MNQVFEDVLPAGGPPAGRLPLRPLLRPGDRRAQADRRHRGEPRARATRSPSRRASRRPGSAATPTTTWSGSRSGGAVKNVVAIAVGMCDGLDMGLNARAGLMTRGLHEITRLGVALGANPLTFQGLSGMGDLILTCTGRPLAEPAGRDRARPGEDARRDHRGHGPGRRGREDDLRGLPLAERLGVEMPIADAVRERARRASSKPEGGRVLSCSRASSAPSSSRRRTRSH